MIDKIYEMISIMIIEIKVVPLNRGRWLAVGKELLHLTEQNYLVIVFSVESNSFGNLLIKRYTYMNGYNIEMLIYFVMVRDIYLLSDICSLF